MGKAIPKLRMIPRQVSLNYLVPRAMRAFETHGDVFKLVLPMPLNIFCLRKPDHIKELSLHSDAGPSKPDIVRNADYFMGNGMFNDLGRDGGATWKGKRDVLKTVFTRANSNHVAERLPGAIDRMTVRWESGGGSPVELFHELKRMVLDFGARALFTETFSDQRLNWVVEATDFAEAMFEAPLPYQIPTPANLKFRRVRQEYHTLLQGLVDERRRGTGDEAFPDVLDALLHTDNPETGRPHTDNEIIAQMFSAYFGTPALTFTVLTGLYFLATRPEMMRKLRDELKAVLGDRPPTESDLGDLPYLRVFVQEVLRAYPSFWGSLRYSKEPIELGGYKFPAKSIIAMMRLAAQRHPDHWEKPDEFIPERHEKRNACPHAWLPFGLGRRTCAGNTLALIFCPLAIASIVQKFDIRFESPDLPLRYGFGVTPGKPMMATMHRLPISAHSVGPGTLVA